MPDTTRQLTPLTFEEWMAALESGAYRKGVEFLRLDGRYCCLGVLAEKEGAGWNELGEVTTNEWGDPVQRGSHSFWSGAVGGELHDFLTTTRWNVVERLATVNDKSDTFAPVIVEARRLYAAWKAQQA